MDRWGKDGGRAAVWLFPVSNNRFMFLTPICVLISIFSHTFLSCLFVQMRWLGQNGRAARRIRHQVATMRLSEHACARSARSAAMVNGTKTVWMLWASWIAGGAPFLSGETDDTDKNKHKHCSVTDIERFVVWLD